MEANREEEEEEEKPDDEYTVANGKSKTERIN